MIARAQDLRVLAQDEAIVDLFAGGGGASEGIRLALGRSPDVAINHDELALRVHALNHPETEHRQENLFKARPFVPAGYRRIGLLWASPDCTHHSQAKGGKPRETGLRLLAWVVVEWAREVHPRVICLENVPEFRQWGPLDDKGQPIKERRGETFREFVAALELAGYRVEHRVLNAADHGERTSRRRLVLIARCDGRPIVWPEASHGPGAPEPWGIAADCIDWSIPMLSIFASRVDARAWARENRWRGVLGVPNRPLAAATMRRIAEGVRRYVLDNPRPFLVHVNHGRDENRSQGLDQPFPTVATGTGAHGFALVAPAVVNTRNGEREGQAPRVRSVEEPYYTITAKGSQGGLVAAFLARNFGGPNGNGNRGVGLDEPTATITAQDHHALAAVHLTKFYGTSVGAELGQPMPTVTAGGDRGGGHAGLVAAFLARYYGSGGQWSGLDDPVPTITTLDRLGLVTVRIDGEEYALVDIGFRMLEPHELARAQGLDPYKLIGTKRQRVRLIGNSVPPKLVRAVVRSNLGTDAPAAEAA